MSAFLHNLCHRETGISFLSTSDCAHGYLVIYSFSSDLGLTKKIYVVNRDDYYQQHMIVTESEGHLQAEIERKVVRANDWTPLVSPICTNRCDCASVSTVWEEGKHW